MMEKLTVQQGQSQDIVADNIARLKQLFPEILTEKKIDFAVLKQLLGEEVEEAEERYSFTWNGKSRARRLAQTPSTGTLRPCKEESKDWDTTQNLFIEGDNLEVLKLLQKSYHQKVKMIYIDPPYNTGKDFIYPDDFRDNIKNYLELTGQTNEQGKKLSANAETSGRYHTNWLNMMYPRIKLARNLLRDDGVIFISIDEKELQSLRYICNDIFGEDCFVAVITVLCNPKGRSQDKYFATNHEYVVAYSKNPLPKGFFAIAKEEDQVEAEYPEEDDGGKYRFLELRNTHREFGRHNRKNLYYPFYVNLEGEVSLKASDGLIRIVPDWDDGFEGCWTWDATKSKKDLDLLVAQEIKGRWKIYRKSYASGADRMLKTILVDKAFYTERGQKVFNQLFNTKTKLFQSPKSPYLLAQLFQTATDGSDIILDFFCGSGTTGHAVMAQNAADGSERRYILVQLPESLDPENKDQKTAADFCDQLGKPRSIAELTKERLRRAAMKVKKDNPDYQGDVGFKALKLDSSNIKPWDADFDTLTDDLLTAGDVIKPERSADDVLFEILLKYGLDLTLPIVTHTLAGKTVFEVGAGALLVCLEEGITEAVAEAIGQLKTTLAPAVCRVVFKDAGFADDAAKVNTVQVLKQFGIDDVKSL